MGQQKTHNSETVLNILCCSTHSKFKLIPHQPTTHSGAPAANHPACPCAVPLGDSTVVDGMMAVAAMVQVELCRGPVDGLHQVMTILLS